MIRFTGMADEHIEIPTNLFAKGENKDKNQYCTYAWIETDEIDSEEFPIAVMDYKPKYSKREEFIFSEPIWHFIADERTPEQQKFIDKNFNKLNDLFINFAQSQGYLN